MAQTQHFRGVETTTYRDHDGALVGVYRGTPGAGLADQQRVAVVGALQDQSAHAGRRRVAGAQRDRAVPTGIPSRSAISVGARPR